MNLVKATASIVVAAFLGGRAMAQMVTGSSMQGFAAAFGLPTETPSVSEIRASVTRTSVPGNILWPKDKLSVTVQIENRTESERQVKAVVRVIAYGTRGIPGDIWKPDVFRIGEVGQVPIVGKVAANGKATFAISPTIPERKGAYGLVVDLGTEGRQFLMSCVRTFKPNSKRVQYPSLSLDDLGPSVLERLGVHAIRWGISYKPTTDPDFERWYQEQLRSLDAYTKANVTVLAMFGGGDFYHPNQPLGRPRPWLDDTGKMLDTKFDLAWLPSYDPDFQKLVTRLLVDRGWPRGPLTAVSLWNEPWEGISISGWGADMLRYRDMYTAMANGVLDARKQGADVLVGGCDSSSNAIDKLFSDGSNAFLPVFDFLSVHYQGMDSFATFKPFVNRKSPKGRVKIWDTESWVANTDDRVAAVIAANRSTGYDRAMGVYGGNISDSDVHVNGGTNAWSVAAAVGASQYFIGDRPFKELLFRNGLPWVIVFDGLAGKPEDGTVVVVGDLGEAFGADHLLFRTARGFKELEHKAAMRKELARLPKAPAGKVDERRQKLVADLNARETLSGATLTLPSASQYTLFDFYGNKVAPKGGRVEVPLDGRGFFLRGDGRKGSFSALIRALRTSRVEGIVPLAVVANDLEAPIEAKPVLDLRLTNVLNRAVSGRLSAQLGGVKLKLPVESLKFKPNETKVVRLPVVGGKSVQSNTYPLTLGFDAGRDGKVPFHEDLHVNFIARRTIKVDGDLADWAGVLPQTIVSSGSGVPSVTEAAWYPFKKFDAATGAGIATGYLSYDDRYFYFGAKVADRTPDGGTLRFETRDDDQYFYPETSFVPASIDSANDFSVRWEGYLVPEKDGVYELTTTSDDGVRLWLDGKMLIDHWDGHGDAEDTVKVRLTAQKRHEIRVEYFQGGGGSRLRLEWQGPGSDSREVIPARALIPKGGDQPGGLSASYFGGTGLQGDPKLVREDATLDFKNFAGELTDPNFGRPSSKLKPLTWPTGVRRYSYRKGGVLPSGNVEPNFDNVQIAFNVLPEARKDFLPNPPGTMPNYTISRDTDYEYALNKVAAQYGGGTEVWRITAPGLPRKHYYPRQPKSPKEGPVRDAVLAIDQGPTTRVVECAIPWREIPEAFAAMKAKRPIKFSFRVNDNSGVGCMELARDRSVAKRGVSFHVDWTEHWENQISFGWQK